MLGLTVVAAFAAGLLVASEPPSPSDEIRVPQRVKPSMVGRGARSARLLPPLSPSRGQVVVFLHGWGLTGPRAYRAWFTHLRRRGITVIVPRYQAGLGTSTERVFGNAVAGLRAAFRRGSPPRGVVVVGHSAGAILALNYAVRARSLRLPPARAVVMAYPGGAIRGQDPLPEPSPALLPASVRTLTVFASPSDAVVGTETASRIHDGASRIPAERRRLITVDDPTAGGHFAPVLDSPAVRRIFWSELDAVLS